MLRNRWLTAIAGTVAIAVLQTTVLPAAWAKTVIFGVVRSPDNARQWPAIDARLQSSGIPYCTVDLETLKHPEDLGNADILFLPNVETINAQQAEALQVWVKRGGKAIVTGPFATLAPSTVRQELQSLLGAYWGFSLSRPAALQPIASQSQSWLQGTELTGKISGGVVIPTGLDSQTAATWQSTDTPPAVVVTKRATFLGWRWGIDAVAGSELDRAWLQAALSRHGQPSAPARQTGQCVPAVAAAPKPATPPPTAPPRRADLPTATPKPLPPLRSRPSSPPAKPAAAVVRAPAPPVRRPAGVAKPAPATNNAAADLTPARPTPSGTRNSALSRLRSRDAGLVDPSDPIYAPDINNIPPGETPITALESRDRLQKLSDLLGRVESAFLAAESASHTTNLRISSVVKTASPTPIRTEGTTLARNSSTTQRAIATARQLLADWNQLLGQHQYSEARQRWQKAHQALLDGYPIDRPYAQAEIRAVWLDRGTIVRAGSERNLAALFDRLAASGINTIFFETINAGYPIYPSQIAPEQNPLTRGWDPLRSATRLARDRGMELHAWMWTFAIGNPRHNALLGLPASYPGPVLSAHPDWAGIDHQGLAYHERSGKRFLDPANRQARRYLLSLIEEIVQNYDVDGVQLDYIRYPFQDQGSGYSFGYGAAARAQFKQRTGVDPMDISPKQQQIWQEWIDFRVEQIDTFVADARQLTRRLDPNLVLSVAVFPMPTYHRIYRLQQHWEAWASQGNVDLIVPMTYGLETHALSRVVQPMLNVSESGTALLVPGIRLLQMPDMLAVDQIQALRNLSTGGYALFAAENLNANLQQIFHRTQGSSQQQQPPVPYRDPFGSAADRFAALKREWSFLLVSDRLQLRPSQQEDWQLKADNLERSLRRLANDPTSQHLAQAKTALTVVQSGFQQWMHPYSKTHPYQVEVWRNQLDSLATLLNYGQRRASRR